MVFLPERQHDEGEDGTLNCQEIIWDRAGVPQLQASSQSCRLGRKIRPTMTQSTRIVAAAAALIMVTGPIALGHTPDSHLLRLVAEVPPSPLGDAAPVRHLDDVEWLLPVASAGGSGGRVSPERRRDGDELSAPCAGRQGDGCIAGARGNSVMGCWLTRPVLQLARHSNEIDTGARRTASFSKLPRSPH